MANYNPHAPQNIGQEWVPIRNENLAYNPFSNSFERGYGFSLGQFRNVSNVRAYVNTMPEKFFEDRAFTASIYKRGYEDQSGPVRRVIIPCNAGIVTGTGGSFTLFRASDVPTAFWNPAGIQAIIYTYGQLNASNTFMFFAVNQYQNLLQNKRILGVNFLTTMDVGLLGVSDLGSMDLWLANDYFIINGVTDGAIRYSQLITPLTPPSDVRFDRIRLGDVSRFFGVTGASNATGTLDVSQWTYNELARFEASASNRINMAFRVPAVGVQSTLGSFTISYAALEVFYCEESRSAFGTKLFQLNDNTLPSGPIPIGAMPINIRTPAAAPVILPPGDYTVTFSESNLGDSYNGLRTPDGIPLFNEIRQLYEIPTVPGLQVDIPFPLNDEAINRTLTARSTDLIPQLSLHASGASFGTLWESHPYGRQTLGEVITSTTTVSQRIDTTFMPAGTSASFPWLRFWARRYGDTVDSLQATVGASTATISVAAFDALDEIVDGWKQVDLRFTSPPTLTSGTLAQVVWSPTTDQNSGNRWEVLGAGAPALTGGPSNQMAQVASPHTLSIATYGQPVSGGLILETWRPQLGPYVSTPTADPISDVSFIFAQDPPAVSGFAVVTGSMAVTGIGQNCGINPCCIPTAILYNQLSWTAQASMNPGDIVSNFNTDVVSGWGFSDEGYAWQTPFGSGSTMSVSSGSAKASLAANASDAGVLIGTGIRNATILAVVSPPALALTSSYSTWIVFRNVDSTNNLSFKFEFDTTGNIDLSFNKFVGGVSTFPATASNVSTYSAGGTVYLKVQLDGNNFRAKAWPTALASEPAAWAIDYFEAINQTPLGSVGMYFDITGGNTNTKPIITSVDSFSVDTVPTLGYAEIQRMDTVDTDWQTIAKATYPYQASFKDYEARVGILSSYRIRNVDANEFPGQWSSTVSVLPPAPGVSGGCVSNGHILIFTTNEVQDGSSNLAYSSVWMDENVSEEFAFPEAGFVQMQAMYDRDFFVSFRPNERGGEQFSRTVLVQAAAISPPTLGDFRSLRDMAWDNVSYICVRDEDGNRWFSTVLVPSGRVLRDRRLYLAPISIVEVTDTPSEVDP